MICFIHKFVLAIFWGPRGNEMGAEGRGSRNTNTLFDEFKEIKYFKKITEFRSLIM